MKQHFAAALSAAFVLGGASFVFAQEAEADGTETAGAEVTTTSSSEGLTLSQVEPAKGLTNETIDDEKVDSFIQAVSMIGQVSAHYSRLAQETEDEERRAFLLENANKDIVKAINAAPNITPAEFVAIDQASQQDNVLSERILTRIEELKDENRPKERLQFSVPQSEQAQ